MKDHGVMMKPMTVKVVTLLVKHVIVVPLLVVNLVTLQDIMIQLPVNVN